MIYGDFEKKRSFREQQQKIIRASMSSILRCAGSSEKTLSPPENKPWVILTVKQQELPKFFLKNVARLGPDVTTLYQFVGPPHLVSMLHVKTWWYPWQMVFQTTQPKQTPNTFAKWDRCRGPWFVTLERPSALVYVYIHITLYTPQGHLVSPKN